MEIKTPERSVEEIVSETARSIEFRLVHKLQIETIEAMDITGQSIEYRKGLRDMRHLVMEHCRELAEIVVRPNLQTERKKREEMVESVRAMKVPLPPEFMTAREAKGYNQAVDDILQAITQTNN